MERLSQILDHLLVPSELVRLIDYPCNAKEDFVLVSLAANGLLVISLNRPAQLNSLNTEMVHQITKAMLDAKGDAAVKAVLLRGEGKAFCAGGDIRSLAIAAKNCDWKVHENFFGPEFVLDHLIYTYPKPVIALLDGITMGGGVGISIGATFRVVTENTVFAMPETGIGFFPDVSGSYFLPRLAAGERVGLHVGLTGTRLRAADCLYTRVATHRIRAADVSSFIQKLKSFTPSEIASKNGIEAMLEQYTSSAPQEEPSLQKNRVEIDQLYAPVSDFSELIQRIEKLASTSAFAKQTLQTLNSKCPTSLFVTLEELKRGAKLSLQECLQMEYAAALHCMRTADFYEGVRAVVLDKDNKPRWSPDRWQDVNRANVNAFFQFKPPEPLQFYK